LYQIFSIGYSPSFLDFVNIHDFKVSAHNVSEGTKQLNNFLLNRELTM
jgi:hypothetical protein